MTLKKFRCWLWRCLVFGWLAGVLFVIERFTVFFEGFFIGLHCDIVRLRCEFDIYD